jgi:hypothetical protein
MPDFDLEHMEKVLKMGLSIGRPSFGPSDPAILALEPKITTLPRQ